MKNMDTLETIRSRASAIRLGEPAPTREQLDAILAAGLNAPDHGRLAPWRYLVLQGASTDLLGRAMAALKRRQSPQAGADILEAARHKVPQIEQTLAVAAAVENMILAAHSLGVGTMWKTGDAAYDPEVKLALGFERDDQIVSFLYLGTPVTPGTPHPGDPKEHVRWAAAEA